MTDKPLSEAERQIRRLIELRRAKESARRDEEERTFRPKTPAEAARERLERLREEAKNPPKRRRRPRMEGKRKSVFLSSFQIEALARLAQHDPRLKGSPLLRLALNRLLDLALSESEMELEQRLHEVLKKLKK